MSDETLKYKSEAIFNPDGTTGFLMVPDFENYSLTANIQHLRGVVEGIDQGETPSNDEGDQNRGIDRPSPQLQTIVDLKKGLHYQKPESAT